MRSLADRLRRQWTLPLTVVIAVAATTPSDAGAQGRSSNATGPSNGTLGGGASGASNRGGAGGASNPSPGAGAPANGGGAVDRGPQTTESSRQGYLGGRTTPTVTPPPDTPPGTSPSAPGAPLTVLPASKFGRCMQPAALVSPQARLSGNNLARIDALADGLMPGAGQTAPAARYLLADLQAELEKPDPDPLLTGTYLGMVSERPVTEDLVTVVSESLCAPPLPPGRARAIAAIAEAQRLKPLSQSDSPDGRPKP